MAIWKKCSWITYVLYTKPHNLWYLFVRTHIFIPTHLSKPRFWPLAVRIACSGLFLVSSCLQMHRTLRKLGCVGVTFANWSPNLHATRWVIGARVDSFCTSAGSFKHLCLKRYSVLDELLSSVKPQRGLVYV